MCAIVRPPSSMSGTQRAHTVNHRDELKFRNGRLLEVVELEWRFLDGGLVEILSYFTAGNAAPTLHRTERMKSRFGRIRGNAGFSARWKEFSSLDVSSAKDNYLRERELHSNVVYTSQLCGGDTANFF